MDSVGSIPSLATIRTRLAHQLGFLLQPIFIKEKES